MPICWGFIGSKGGVLKSTSARALAVELARVGYGVKILDMDPAQCTTLRWHERRVNAGIKPSVDVEMVPADANVAAVLKKCGAYDVVIMHSAGKADRLTLDIARISDLVVLPTGPGLDDLDPAVRVCNGLVERGVPRSRMRLALTRTQTESETEEARAWLERAGLTVLPGSLPERPLYRRAQSEGRAVTEVWHPGLKNTACAYVQAIVDAAAEHPETV